jgi:hypothetical protein
MNYNYLADDNEYRDWKQMLLLLGLGLTAGAVIAFWTGTYLFIRSKPVILPSAASVSEILDK